MTITLRPTGDARVVGVTTVPSGSVASVTNDNNLGTYAKGIQDRGFAWLDLGTSTLGALRVKTTQLRVQNAHDSVGAGIQAAWIRLRDPSDGTVSDSLYMPRGSTVVNQQRGGLLTSAPNGKAWVQAVLDRMQVEIAWLASADGNYLRVHEIYVDLETRTQPTVTTPTVTNFTTSTRPAVSVGYAQAEGEPQTRSQVKVFSAAQYGAGGFTADGSGSTWDSGVLFGATDSVTVGADLVNGITYKAYVRAAMDWPGPEGDVWWSAWVASSAFTVAVLPPPTPTLTVTADTALPGFRVLLSAFAPYNLLSDQDAGLEATGVGNWLGLTNATVARSTAQFKSGVASLAVTATAAANVNAGLSSAGRKPVAGSQQYTAQISVRAATAARTVRCELWWYDATGAGPNVIQGSTATDSTSAWTNYFCTATLPANAASAGPVLFVQSPGAGEVHYVDEADLHAGATTAFSTGGFTPTVTLERLLRVSADRGEARNWANPQLASGGGLTRGTDGFYARTTSLLYCVPLDGPGPAGLSQAQARMVVWRPQVGAFNGVDVGLNNSTTDDPAPPYLMPAVPGRAQTLSTYLKGSSAVNARIFVIPVDATNTQVGVGTEVSSSTVALSTSAWTRYAATITPPAGTVYLRGFVELPSGNADLDVKITGVQLELGSAATALAPGTGVTTPTWETVRALESTAPRSPGETYVAFDHEVPPARPVLYRARTVAGTLASSPAAPQAVYLDAPARNLLKDPFQPENAVIVNIDPKWSESRSRQSQSFTPAGRDAKALGVADPVILTDWVGSQDGAYSLGVLSEVDLYRLHNLSGSTRPLLIQFSEGGCKYALIDGDEAVERVGYGTFRLGVKLVECARPA